MSDAPFDHGSTWVRADFHLHTKLDKEFTYKGEENDFGRSFVDTLGASGIRIGVIANHDKFDLDEFRALKSRARKQGIALLPGVELTVAEGAGGIHAIVVFCDDWTNGNVDQISPMLTVLTDGRPGERTQKNLLAVIDALEKQEMDFFIVCAHVEDGNGIWRELQGGRLEQLGRSESFRRRVLAFQKVRTHDVPDRVCRVKVQGWLTSYPAEVEGCDCKSIEEIGKGQPGFLKLGAATFEAVKFALLDQESRVAKEVPMLQRSWIDQISFEGGLLGGTTLKFSPELNTLIGIRGSGKSAIIEALRYALDIPFGENVADREYKDKLIGHLLKSGGKLTVHSVDRHGNRFEVRRIWNQAPEVFVENLRQPGISLHETVIRHPIYFGQKDLSSGRATFERDLVERLLGTHLEAPRKEIADRTTALVEAVQKIKKLGDAAARRENALKQKADAEFRLKVYEKHGVEDRLQEQVDFETDVRHSAKVTTRLGECLTDLKELISKHEDDLRDLHGHQSTRNAETFDRLYVHLSAFVAAFSTLKSTITSLEEHRTGVQAVAAGLAATRDSLKERFAEVERTLEQELHTEGAPTISPEEFKKLKGSLARATEMLAALDKEQSVEDAAKRQLDEAMSELDQAWHAEFRTLADILNSRKTEHLEVEAVFKGDKDAFKAFMKGAFQGTRQREEKLGELAEHFPDFAAMYRDLAKAETLVGAALAPAFRDRFHENLATLLAYQVPTSFTIRYRGKVLAQHSLGQRVSAIILWIMSQKEGDVVIIDQPEDDLDNQTIYDDVIKLVRALKPSTQFIFATHNPNIPVLGDAEQVVVCTADATTLSVETGSIDAQTIQHRIVDIMEGGQEAFRRRQERYSTWNTPSSSS